MEQSDIVDKAQDSLKKLASTGMGMSLTVWDEVSNNLLECTAEITRLRAALADAQAVGFAAGVEAAAQMAEDWFYDPENDVVTDVRLRDAIRALTPPDATAAAARVLLPGMEQRHIYHMTSLGRDPEKYTSEYRMAAKALRAIAGDTP